MRYHRILFDVVARNNGHLEGEIMFDIVGLKWLTNILLITFVKLMER